MSQSATGVINLCADTLTFLQNAAHDVDQLFRRGVIQLAEIGGPEYGQCLRQPDGRPPAIRTGYNSRRAQDCFPR
jgi:hypothetical protein